MRPTAPTCRAPGHNAHKTGAVVTPGIVSTGHLTARPRLGTTAYSGDYWWLETQRGHSYRVEVKFGDNPDNDTGGSAWMYVHRPRPRRLPVRERLLRSRP